MNAAKRLDHVPSVRRASGVQPVSNVRSQAAFVRTLLDEVERGLPADLEDPMSVQLVEELGRLGCLCVELAAELSALVEQQERTRARCA